MIIHTEKLHIEETHSFIEIECLFIKERPMMRMTAWNEFDRQDATLPNRRDVERLIAILQAVADQMS